MNSPRLYQKMGKEIACIKESCKVQKINPEVLMSFDWEFQGWEKKSKRERQGERERQRNGVEEVPTTFR